MRTDPSLIGTVQDVCGTTITVALTDETATGVSFISGGCYRVGQVGSFVRIPIGFIDLYGLVSQVGAGAAPAKEEDQTPYGNRWLQVQLVCEGSLDQCRAWITSKGEAVFFNAASHSTQQLKTRFILLRKMT